MKVIDGFLLRLFIVIGGIYLPQKWRIVKNRRKNNLKSAINGMVKGKFLIKY